MVAIDTSLSVLDVSRPQPPQGTDAQAHLLLMSLIISHINIYLELGR